MLVNVYDILLSGMKHFMNISKMKANNIYCSYLNACSSMLFNEFFLRINDIHTTSTSDGAELQRNLFALKSIAHPVLRSCPTISEQRRYSKRKDANTFRNLRNFNLIIIISRFRYILVLTILPSFLPSNTSTIMICKKKSNHHQSNPMLIV